MISGPEHARLIKEFEQECISEEHYKQRCHYGTMKKVCLYTEYTVVQIPIASFGADHQYFG